MRSHVNTSLRRKLALELDGVSGWGRGLSAIVIEIAGWSWGFSLLRFNTA